MDIRRVQMIANETLFYKWVNGLVALPPSIPPTTSTNDSTSNSDSVTAALATSFPSVHTHMTSAQSFFHSNAAAHLQLRGTFERAWAAASPSVKRTQQLQRAMERVEHDVITRELFDPHALFTQSAASLERQQQRVRGASAATKPPLASELHLETLRQQLEQVVREIATEYCGAELR